MNPNRECKHLYSTDGNGCLYCGEEKPDRLDALIRQIVRDEVRIQLHEQTRRKPHFITKPEKHYCEDCGKEMIDWPLEGFELCQQCYDKVTITKPHGPMLVQSPHRRIVIEDGESGGVIGHIDLPIVPPRGRSV